MTSYPVVDKEPVKQAKGIMQILCWQNPSGAVWKIDGREVEGRQRNQLGGSCNDLGER